MRGQDCMENILTNPREGEEGFSKHFQNCNFKKANKKLITVYVKGSEKILKYLENHQHVHGKY
jgi:hypothetical protein